MIVKEGRPMWQACETGGPQVVDDFACSASSGISCRGARL
jgi:hypothetical protein